MSNSSSAEARTVTIKKTFNAPRQLVWEAWTNPDHIANWWGPKGMQTRVITYEFKVGGKWEYAMAMPDGKDFISRGEFLEIVEPERLCSLADFVPMTTGVEIQALFAEAGDQTEFTFNVVHATVEYRQQQEAMGIYKGWGSVFNGLATYLEQVAQ